MKFTKTTLSALRTISQDYPMTRREQEARPGRGRGPCRGGLACVTDGHYAVLYPEPMLDDAPAGEIVKLDSNTPRMVSEIIRDGARDAHAPHAILLPIRRKTGDAA